MKIWEKLGGMVDSENKKCDKKDFIAHSLACPVCLTGLDVTKNKCSKCGYEFTLKEGVPIFIDKKSAYIDRMKGSGTTNPYSPKSLEIIAKNPEAKILDFGAGNPKEEELFNNVIRLEFVRYKSTDVVSTEKRIPFRDGVFDYVISESVFEHVDDPFYYAKEIFRVLKRGGLVLVDTAFLQPVHADPYHFFNMTLEGLRKVFGDFKEIRAGVESYQTASYTLNILMNSYYNLIDNDQVKKEFKNKFIVDYKQYNKYIPEDKQHIMSAGVYFVGEKP
jgi:SAM-dependent methyltransferase